MPFGLIIERIFVDGYFVTMNTINYLRSQRMLFLFDIKEYISVKEHIENFLGEQLQITIDSGVDIQDSRKVYC